MVLGEGRWGREQYGAGGGVMGERAIWCRGRGDGGEGSMVLGKG